MSEKLRYEVTVDGVNESNQKLNSLGDGFRETAIDAGVLAGAVIAVKKGFDIMISSVDTFFTQRSAENMVSQALITTGNAAGFTSDELQKVASSLQNVSNFGDEEILAQATNSLLTFKNISGETFLRTQQAVVDMAA
jgi:hypothetical protein